MLAEAEDGLLLATVHMYSPAVVTSRVWLYCPVTRSSNTVSSPSVSGTESLVQVTVVAGPPVEIQVRVSRSRSSMMLPDSETPPEFTQKKTTKGIYKVFNTGFSCTFIGGI